MARFSASRRQRSNWGYDYTSSSSSSTSSSSSSTKSSHDGQFQQFVKLISFCRHTAAELSNVLLDFQQYSFYTQDCRNQSYDKAANIRGRYNDNLRLGKIIIWPTTVCASRIRSAIRCPIGPEIWMQCSVFFLFLIH